MGGKILGMATVKTQGGKVITKGGKVSCSCCETGCCMYPAQALGDGLYTVDDLPDSISVSLDGSNFYTFEKDSEDGNFYSTQEINLFPAGNLRIALFDTGNEYDPINSPEDFRYYWYLQEKNPDWSNAEGRGRLQCLIADADGLTIEDQFADTYTLTYNPPQGGIPIQIINNGIALRESLCVWNAGECEPGSFGASLFYSEFRNKFVVGLSEAIPEGGGFQCEAAGIYVKTGNQNTPLGTYSNDFETITVS